MTATINSAINPQQQARGHEKSLGPCQPRPIVADSDQNIRIIGDDVVDPPLDQPVHLTGIVDGPHMHFLADAMGRANQFIGKALRPDAERFDVKPADVSQGVGDNEPRSQRRVVSFHIDKGVAIERRHEAIGLEAVLAYHACHPGGEAPIGNLTLQLDVQLDSSAGNVGA